MGGFDIASLRGRTSFTANLQKRKYIPNLAVKM